MHFLPLLYMAFGFLVYVLIIFCLLKIKNHHFLSTDPKPKFHPLSELEVEQDISKIYSIKTGIVIEEFQQFDVLHNQFSMSCLVCFQFNPNLVSLETIEKFSFLKCSSIEKHQNEISLVGKDIWVQYKVKLHFTTNFNHQYFPLNDHNIYISLANHDLNAEEFILESHVSGAKIKQNFEIQDWKIIGSHSEAGFDYTEVPFKHIKSNPRPILMYTLDFKKAGLSKTNLILLPLILILFIVSSTILHPAMPQTLLVGVLCLTSILTYRYVINGLSPTVGYFTFADHIYNTSLMLTFFSFLIISLRQIYPELSHPYFDLSYFIFTKICMIGMFTYLLFFDNQKGSSKINIQNNIKSKKLHLSDWTLKKIEQRLLHYHENHFWSKFNYPIMS